MPIVEMCASPGVKVATNGWPLSIASKKAFDGRLKAGCGEGNPRKTRTIMAQSKQAYARWYAKNGDKCRDRSKEWYAAHKERARGNARRYAAAHPDRILIARKKWVAEGDGMTKATRLEVFAVINQERRYQDLRN
jgi:hypothetical protein